MKLERNKHGAGKYAIVKLRALGDGSLSPAEVDACREALSMLEGLGVLEYGPPGSDSEFFVIKLRDRFARNALFTYANDASRHDEEYAQDVNALAERAGIAHPHWKVPD